MRRRINARLMDAGVRMTDPERTYVDVGVRIGQDTLLRPGTHLAGDSTVGKDCVIGPSAVIEDTRIDDGALVELSVVRGPGSAPGPRWARTPTSAGNRPRARREKPAASWRSRPPGSARGARSRTSPTLETPRSGGTSSIGAGTADRQLRWRYEKHRTVIGDDVRIGSDTMLAPVRVGKGAVTGAGSVITKDVPAGALAVERTEQRTNQGYRRRKDWRRLRGSEEREHGPGDRHQEEADDAVRGDGPSPAGPGDRHRARGRALPAELAGSPAARSISGPMPASEAPTRSCPDARRSGERAVMEQLIMIDALKRASASASPRWSRTTGTPARTRRHCRGSRSLASSSRTASACPGRPHRGRGPPQRADPGIRGLRVRPSDGLPLLADYMQDAIELEDGDLGGPDAEDGSWPSASGSSSMRTWRSSTSDGRRDPHKIERMNVVGEVSASPAS